MRRRFAGRDVQITISTRTGHQSHAFLRETAGRWLAPVRPPPHGDAPSGIESLTSFGLQDAAECRGQCRRRDFRETDPRVEGHVPRDAAKRGERHRQGSAPFGPATHARDEPRPKASASVLGTDIQLLEVNRIGLEQLHVGEPDRRVAHERNPEATFAPCALQHPVVGDVVENCVRCVPAQQLGRSELYGGKQGDVTASRSDNSVSTHRALIGHCFVVSAGTACVETGR
jgi:hypothetical protein